jgi:glucose-1-phosphate thymidylyltransferase
MKVVIPMAGYGTRLRPHTWSKPKPLVAVAGRPLLGHVLDTFVGLPFVDEVIFIVGYLGQQVEDYVRQAYPGVRARYIEQREMLGQSHAIWLARQHLAGPMLMVFVDTLIEATCRIWAGEGQCCAYVKVPDLLIWWLVGQNGRSYAWSKTDVSNNLAVVGHTISGSRPSC